jgi:secreted trypsin-like serine protease
MRALKDHLKQIARALVVALVVASPLAARADDADIGGEPDRGQTRVIGGHKAADGAWLSQVKIFAPDPAGRGRYRALCGGTAIASEWILTAAHCFVAAVGTEGRRQTVAAADLLVVVGLAHVPAVIVQGDDIARKALKVKTVVYHPEFQPSVFGNDIALVQLDKPTGVPAMPITGPDDRNSDLAGLSATIVGWGFTQESDGTNTDLLPADLQEVEMPIVDITTCKTAYTTSALKGNSIDDRNICAGFKAGGRDACRGDSGGPLMVRAETGEWVQAGIVSWGEGCGRRDRYGVYTRLSAFEGWVRQITGGQVARPLRPSQEARFVDTQTVATLSPADGLDQDTPLFQLTSPTELARAAARIAPGDRALVIGIDGYSAPLALSGSVTDATAIAGMLVDELGFRREQVLTLTNEKATRANILAALDTWLLQGSHAGSRVYFYYSGQGFQSRVFPSLRDSESGPSIAPVDLALINDNDGKVRDVANAISASEIRNYLSRLSNRSVTVVFDASQISRRQMQRPARASADEVGSVRSVEAVVDLAPDISEVALSHPGTAIDPGDNLALWTATAPDQWALVDKRGDVPMGVFTRSFIDGLRATKLVSRGGQADTSLGSLAKTIAASSDRFCETNVRLCRLGVNPQLIAPQSLMMASLTAGARSTGIVARSVPIIQNSAGVVIEQKPDAKVAGRSTIVVTARKAGYLMVIRIYPDGSLRQIFPDLTRLASADATKRKDKAKRPLIDANQIAANQPFLVPVDQSSEAARAAQTGGILLAVLADQPVQGIDLPENSFAHTDAFGTLFFIHDYSATLKVPQANGTMKDVEWSFDAKVLPDATAAQ